MTIKAVVGEEHTFSYEVDYTDLVNAAVGAQSAVTIHEILPEGWGIQDIRVETITAFNGSGTRALDMGVTGAATAFFTGLDVKAAGIKAPTVVKYRSTAPAAIIATLTTATDNPTAGKVLITITLQLMRREN